MFEYMLHLNMHNNINIYICELYMYVSYLYAILICVCELLVINHKTQICYSIALSAHSLALYTNIRCSVVGAQPIY